jgi:hypothetical protein
MGFGKQPSPPTLDYGASQRLTRADYELKEEFIPRLTDRTGDAGREEYARNLGFALRSFTDPASVIYSREIADANKELAAAREQAASMDSWRSSGAGGIFGVATGNQRFDPINKKWISNAEYDRLRAAAPSRVASAEANLARYTQADPVGDLQRTFAPEFAARDRLLGQMEAAASSTAEYNRMQQALGRGVSTQQADMERVQAQQTDESALGRSLMDDAMRKVAQGGQLSPEAQREATQSARQAFAARGMATGNAAAGAELLNRDRFARQREFENLGFAQTVEANDLARRTGNTQLRQQAGMQNAQAFNQLSQFNTLQRADTDRFNLGLLQTSAQAAEGERLRQLGLGESAYNFRLQTNPKMMLAGLGSPYANFTPQAIGLMGGQNVQPIYTGGQFSSGGMGGALMGGAMGALGGAASGAALGTAIGPGYGTILGAGLGALGGLTGFMSGSR